MKKSIKIFLLAIILMTGFYIYRAGSYDNFLAKILRDGNYLLNLVTKDNSLDKYAPQNLVELSALGARGQYIRDVAYNNLEAMMNDAKEDDVALKVISSYRSFNRQEQVFGYWSANDPEANRYSAEAGHSEHQLGTTIDFGSGDRSTDLTQQFGETPQGKWLARNAYKHGFAMSYPKDKESITGYIYEPWHYRFIGVEAAGEWHESELTLTEFLNTKPQYYRLIRRHDDYKVYSVDPDSSKHWITTAEKFIEMGYDWSDIVIVNYEEFNLYAEGVDI